MRRMCCSAKAMISGPMEATRSGWYCMALALCAALISSAVGLLVSRQERHTGPSTAAAALGSDGRRDWPDVELRQLPACEESCDRARSPVLDPVADDVEELLDAFRLPAACPEPEAVPLPRAVFADPAPGLAPVGVLSSALARCNVWRSRRMLCALDAWIETSRPLARMFR